MTLDDKRQNMKTKKHIILSRLFLNKPSISILFFVALETTHFTPIKFS